MTAAKVLRIFAVRGPRLAGTALSPAGERGLPQAKRRLSVTKFSSPARPSEWSRRSKEGVVV